MENLLGFRCRDKATGFEGVATARSEFLNGCIRYSLEALREGKVITEGFDETSLEVVDEQRVVEPFNTEGQVPDEAVEVRSRWRRRRRTGGPHDREEQALRRQT